MTPEEYIGHKAFRVVHSKRWPPVDENNCYASWLQLSDGTEILYKRGVVRDLGMETLPDAVAREVTGDGCHRCVVQFAYGELSSGHYNAYFATTNRLGRENPWGMLCFNCRLELAIDARKKYFAELNRLNIKEESLCK